MSFAPFPDWPWDIPDSFNIAVACLDQHLGTPVAGRVAMIVEDEARGTSQATYAELAERTSRFAQLLRNLGVALNDRVLIRLPNSLDYPTAFFGAMKRGAISVPTSTLLTGEEVMALIRDSGAGTVVIDKPSWQAFGARLTEAGGLKRVLLAGPGEVTAVPKVEVLDLEPALAAITDWEPAHETLANDPAYIVYTSGTTGVPKGVLHAHRALLGRQPAAEYWFDFGPTPDRIVHSGKFNWTYVLGSGMMDPLYRGHSVIAYEGKNDATTWPRLIAKHSATMFIGVPTVYRQIIQKTQFTRQDVPTLRCCMSAGEHLSDEIFAQWRARFGMDIYEAVGMSEISYYLSQSKHRPIRPGSAGFPQPGHDVKILDPDTLEEVGVGEEGMICIPDYDPGLFLQYWRFFKETLRVVHDGWFFTGDYARYDEDGYIWFLGRKDDLINSFGYRVSPYEVERVLKSHPDVADCACIGEDVERDKRLVVAYIIPQPGATVDPDQLLAFGKERLASYKAPKVIYVAHEFPRTKNGKILRQQVKPNIAVARSGS